MRLRSAVYLMHTLLAPRSECPRASLRHLACIGSRPPPTQTFYRLMEKEQRPETTQTLIFPWRLSWPRRITICLADDIVRSLQMLAFIRSTCTKPMAIGRQQRHGAILKLTP